MFNDATVTLSLEDLDALRADAQEHKNIASALSYCFEIECNMKPEPKECQSCRKKALHAFFCACCEFYEGDQMFNGKIKVDIEQLISVSKQYALYNKDIEIDIDAITIERLVKDVEE